MKPQTVQRIAWAFTAYLLGVILFGAWVRISHSGAGCGAHWPLCDGELIPTDPSTEKIVEYTHRVTSGLCGIFGMIMIWLTARLDGWSSRATRAASVTMAFILVEGLVGAGLVLAELVADDSSAARAIIIALHLTNTMALTGSSALTAEYAVRPRQPLLPSQHRGLFAAMAGALIAISMTGAITALGDTLFPVQPAADGSLLTQVKDELSAGQHFLVRLRIVHPILALLGSMLLFFGFDKLRDTPARDWAKAGLWLTGLQMLMGLINVALAAPGYAQMLHLLLAQGLWICLVVAAGRANPSDDGPSPT